MARVLRTVDDGIAVLGANGKTCCETSTRSLHLLCNSCYAVYAAETGSGARVAALRTTRADDGPPPVPDLLRRIQEAAGKPETIEQRMDRTYYAPIRAAHEARERIRAAGDADDEIPAAPDLLKIIRERALREGGR